MHTGAGVLVTAALGHEGAGRRLVHQLKYTGSPEAARLLGAAMADVVPQQATALVPLPRARIRHWRNGVDPAVALAVIVAKRTGLPMVTALSPAWWWPRHAGRSPELRATPSWRSRCAPEPGWVLVDDVATTGSTIDAAVAVLGDVVRLGVVATSPGRVGHGMGSQPAPSSWEVAWQVVRGPHRGPGRHATP